MTKMKIIGASERSPPPAGEGAFCRSWIIEQSYPKPLRLGEGRRLLSRRDGLPGRLARQGRLPRLEVVYDFLVHEGGADVHHDDAALLRDGPDLCVGDVARHV